VPLAGERRGVAARVGSEIVSNYSSPAVAAGKVFVGSSAGHLAVLDAASGALPPEAKGRLRVCQGCLGDGIWFFSASRFGTGVGLKKDPAHGGATLAVDPQTGRLLWKSKQHSVFYTAGMNYRDGTLYVYETCLATHALEGKTGRLLWSSDKGPWHLQPLTDLYVQSQGKAGQKGGYCTDKVFANGVYYSNYGHSSSALVGTVGEAGGKEVWRFCPLSRACPTPAIAYGRLYYAANGEGVVYCFENAEPAPSSTALPAPGAPE